MTPIHLSLSYVLSVPSGRPIDEWMPMVIVMHGRGGDGWGLASLATRLDPPGGCRFLFPNAPRQWFLGPGIPRGFTWFDGWPPEPQSLAHSRAPLLAFVQEAAQRYRTTPGKVIVAGFSQGALMAFDAGYRTSVPVAAIVSMSGGIAENDLPDLASRRWVPVLMVHGTYDDVVPVERSRRTGHILAAHAIAPEYYEFPVGHYVPDAALAVVAEFIARRLVSAGAGG
jgi:phospholipase/carboxylesterase